MKSYDLSTIRMVADGSEEFVLKMVKAFMVNTPQAIQEIYDCLEEADYDEVAKLAHKIKPSIDMMEISDLKSVIREAEECAKQRNITRLNEMLDVLKTGVEGVISELKHDLGL